MEAEADQERIKGISPLRIRLIGFVILSIVVVVLLGLLGAPPLLILEVFGLAGVLAISAIAVIIILGGRSHLRRI